MSPFHLSRLNSVLCPRFSVPRGNTSFYFHGFSLCKREGLNPFDSKRCSVSSQALGSGIPGYLASSASFLHDDICGKMSDSLPSPYSPTCLQVSPTSYWRYEKLVSEESDSQQIWMNYGKPLPALMLVPLIMFVGWFSPPQTWQAPMGDKQHQLVSSQEERSSA